MSTLVQPPFPTFTDVDGDPLENGYIYIGVAGLNPLANPLQAYWDAAMTIPAASPIRTKGGYPVYSGSPGRLYVPDNYSILVNNKNGTLVYSNVLIDFFNDPSGGSVHKVDTIADLRGMRGYTASFPVQVLGYYTPGDGGGGAIRYWDAASVEADDGGSIIRPTTIAIGDPGRWKWDWSGRLNVRWFGAKGDGVTDDYAAIIAAHNSLPAAGGCLYVPRGDFLVATTINLTKKVDVEGDGAATTNGQAVGSRIIKAATLNGSCIQCSALGIRLANFTVQGVVGNGGDGIEIIESRVILDNVAVFRMGNDGIRIGTDIGGNANLFRLVNVKSKNNLRNGIHISSHISPILPDANAGTVISADTTYNMVNGIYVGNANFNSFINAVCQVNGEYGIRLSPTALSNIIMGGDFEVNGRAIDPGTGFPGTAGNTAFHDIFVEAGAVGTKVICPTTYNFPQSLRIDELSVTILDIDDGSYANDKQFRGLHLPNVPTLNPRVLAHYQEDGSFLPRIIGTTAAGVGTYTTQTGEYTRIGNLVFFKIALTWTAHTGTGNMNLTDLPFTSTAGFGPVQIVSSTITMTDHELLMGMVVGASKNLNLYSSRLTVGAGTYTTTIASVAMDVAGTLYIAGCYTTSE